MQDVSLQVQDWIAAEGERDLVSIVIPTCNRSALLLETLESIEAQNYRPIQIVIVDDDSVDDTAEVVKAFMARTHGDLDVRYHRQLKAGGPAARNRGVVNATGEFIVFMDDDDVFAPGFLASHGETLRANPTVNVSYCRWQRFEVQNDRYALLDVLGAFPASATSPWEAFLLGWPLLLQGCVLRRSAVRAVGPWRLDLLKSQDLDYKARLLASQPRVVEAPTAFAFYRLHKASVTGQLNAEKLTSYCVVLDHIQRLAEARDDYDELRSRIADYLWSHAYWLNSHGALKESRAVLRMAKRHDRNVAKRNGPRAARILSQFGLDSISGPLLYWLFRAKIKLRGAPVRKVTRYVDELPDCPCGENPTSYSFDKKSD